MPRIDITKNWIRKRQFEPSECKKDSYITKKLSKDKQIVLCKKKNSNKYSVQSKRTRRKLK